MELEGATRSDFSCPTSIYAHVSKPVRDQGREVQYAILDIYPRSGIMNLGNINPETRVFEHFDPGQGIQAHYRRADNHVVCEVFVPVEQLRDLKTIDDVLSIPGITVKRELIPQ